MNPYTSFETAVMLFTTAYMLSVMILLTAANTALIVVGMIEEFDD